MTEQLAANALLERVKRPVNAHGADVEQLGRAREVAGFHVSQEHFQLAEGDFLTDPVWHCRYLHMYAAGSSYRYCKFDLAGHVRSMTTAGCVVCIKGANVC